MNDQISRKKTPVPKRIMAMFGVSTGPLVAHMMRRGKFQTTKFSQAYRVEYNSSHLIVGNSATRPVQFSFGSLPSGATFTEKQGHGWNQTNVAEYFQVSDEDNGEIRKEQKMISSKQFEAHHIMLWTMRSIKVTKVKNSEKKQFHIQCQTKNYQYGNRGIRQRHPTMFKEETFSFTPIDDLVLSMPFEFIRNLKVGIWTKIERNWMKRLQKHLGQAENNTIIQVRETQSYRFLSKFIHDVSNVKKTKTDTTWSNAKYVLLKGKLV